MNDKKLSIELKTRPDICQGCQQPTPIPLLKLVPVMAWDTVKRQLCRMKIMLCCFCLEAQHEYPEQGQYRYHNEPESPFRE